MLKLFDHFKNLHNACSYRLHTNCFNEFGDGIFAAFGLIHDYLAKLVHEGISFRLM